MFCDFPAFISLKVSIWLPRITLQSARKVATGTGLQKMAAMRVGKSECSHPHSSHFQALL